MIGAQAKFAYSFSIDSHKLLLIGTDGYLIEPVEVDYIIIHTGERYDFLLSADQPRNKNYLIRAETLEVNCSTLVRDESLENNDAIAVLTYNGNAVDKPSIQEEYESGKRNCSLDNVCKVANCPFENYVPSSGYDCSKLHIHELKLLVPTPKNELPQSDKVDLESTWFFNFGFDGVELTSTVNGRNFLLPTTALQTQGYGQIQPELCKELNDVCNETENDCKCVQIIDIGKDFSGKTVRFVFSSLNTTQGYAFAHPIHLHGHSFHIVKTGYGSYFLNGSLDEATADISCDRPCLGPPEWTNNTSPDISITNKTICKDTVIAPAGGYVVVDFIADNPGFWFLHCHIETHQLEGMALVINELESLQNPPPSGLSGCGNFNWTVKQFNNKLHFKAEGSKGKGLTDDLAIKVFVPISTLVLGFIIGISVTLCVWKKPCSQGRKGYSSLPQNT